MPQLRPARVTQSHPDTRRKPHTIPLTTLQWAVMATLRGNPYQDLRTGRPYSYRLTGPERAIGDRMVERKLLRRSKSEYTLTQLGARSFEAAMRQA